MAGQITRVSRQQPPVKKRKATGCSVFLVLLLCAVLGAMFYGVDFITKQLNF